MPSPALPSFVQLTPQETQFLADAHQELARRLTDGPLPFSEYMDWALYSESFGYYTHREVFGAHGDYITAPTLSPAFGACLARQCAEILRDGGGSIIEVGGGTGRLAVDILKTLTADGAPPSHYWIIEKSPLLRSRASALIAAEIPEWVDRVTLSATWPPEQASVILANELIDALPAQRFRMRSGLARTLCITETGGQLGFVEGAVDHDVSGYLRTLMLPDDYESETIPAAETFLTEAAKHLDRGAIFLIDYGFPRHEFYHPDRGQGTLMCHFRQHAHANPLILAGLQDITCHVDFTALAQMGMAEDLQLAGYTSQAAFLLSLGLGEDLPGSEREAMVARQAIKRLTLPHEMGELFKVIAFTRKWPSPLQGFRFLDRRHTLGL